MKEILWFKQDLSLADVQNAFSKTAAYFMGIEWVSVQPQSMQMRMPVSERTRQPFGLLHGGASCVLAETIGSVASYFIVDPEKYMCVGLEINANHVKGVKEGYVYATAAPLHIGRSTHVWNIRIENESGALVCISRLTVAVVAKA